MLVGRTWWSQRTWKDKELTPKEVSYDDPSSRFKTHTKAWKEKAGRIQMKQVNWRGWWSPNLSIKLVPKPKHLEGSTPWGNLVLILAGQSYIVEDPSCQMTLACVKLKRKWKKKKERKLVSKPAQLIPCHPDAQIHHNSLQLFLSQ